MRQRQLNLIVVNASDLISNERESHFAFRIIDEQISTRRIDEAGQCATGSLIADQRFAQKILFSRSSSRKPPAFCVLSDFQIHAQDFCRDVRRETPSRSSKPNISLQQFEERLTRRKRRKARCVARHLARESFPAQDNVIFAFRFQREAVDDGAADQVLIFRTHLFDETRWNAIRARRRIRKREHMIISCRRSGAARLR